MKGLRKDLDINIQFIGKTGYYDYRIYQCSIDTSCWRCVYCISIARTEKGALVTCSNFKPKIEKSLACKRHKVLQPGKCLTCAIARAENKKKGGKE